MPTFILVDGDGVQYDMQFASNEKVIEFAERSQNYTRPRDRVKAVYTLDGHVVWPR